MMTMKNQLQGMKHIEKVHIFLVFFLERIHLQHSVNIRVHSGDSHIALKPDVSIDVSNEKKYTVHNLDKFFYI